MKNTNLKLNKTNLVARLMLVVILIVGVLNLTGCVKSQLESGDCFQETYWGHPISLRVVYEEKYSINNVNLKLYVGLHKKEYSLFDWSTKDIKALLSESYDISEMPNYYDDVYYVIYMANPYLDESNVDGDMIREEYILKEISYGESLKDGIYNYTKMPYTGERYYNNCETITIPSDYFVETGYNKFYIVLTQVEKINGEYNLLIDPVYVGIEYYDVDNGQVSLKVSYTK